jgi:hypothetical protein
MAMCARALAWGRDTVALKYTNDPFHYARHRFASCPAYG